MVSLMNPNSEITIKRDNGGKNDLPLIITTIILAIISAFVIWWEAVEVVRLIEEGCEKMVDEHGRSSYPSKLKCE